MRAILTILKIVISLVACLGLVGGMTYIISTNLFALQRCLYEKPGEVIYGSGHIIVAALGLSLTLYCVVMIIMMRFFKPKRLDVKETKKVLTWLAIFMVMFSVFFLMSFNVYLKFSEGYIAASGWSYRNNETKYKYDDVKISRGSGRGRQYYIFRFPDGKEVYHIFNEKEALIKLKSKLGQDLAITSRSINQKQTQASPIIALLFIPMVIYIINRIKKTSVRP